MPLARFESGNVRCTSGRSIICYGKFSSQSSFAYARTSEWQSVPYTSADGCCRLVYNLCLDQKTLERERSKPRRLSQFDQIKELAALKVEFDFLREVPHHPWSKQ